MSGIDPAGLVTETLIDSETLQARIAELGAQITSDYADDPPLLVCVLKGAFMFVADLVRAIDLPVEVDFMAISSYGSGTQTSGIVRIVKDLEISIEGRAVIVVEDIVDSGLTLSYLLKSLQARRPSSLAICALLTKPERREVDVPVTYVGFEIPNKFVVGYGLDMNERFRNLRLHRRSVATPDDHSRAARYPESVRTTHVGACPLDCPDTCSWVLEADDGRVSPSAATRRSRSRTAPCAGRSTGTSTT